MSGFGVDNTGKQYRSIDAMWQRMVTNSDGSNRGLARFSRARWYGGAENYWQASDVSRTAMCGANSVHTADIDSLRSMLSSLPVKSAVADVGGGSARVSSTLLCRMFQHIEVVDVSRRQLRTARRRLLARGGNELHPVDLGLDVEEEALDLMLDNGSSNGTGTINAFTFSLCHSGAQDWQPTRSFDLVLLQWMAQHLIDEDFVRLLERARDALTENGTVLVKDNHTRLGEHLPAFIVDLRDHSVTRSKAHYERLFTQANLQIVSQTPELGMPCHFFPVTAWILAPAKTA